MDTRFCCLSTTARDDRFVTSPPLYFEKTEKTSEIVAYLLRAFLSSFDSFSRAPSTLGPRTTNLSFLSDFSISFFFCPLSVSGNGLPSTYAANLITVLLAGVITTTLAFIGLPFSGMTAYVISYPSFAVKTIIAPEFSCWSGRCEYWDDFFS